MNVLKLFFITIKDILCQKSLSLETLNNQQLVSQFG
jgi:hypothetical protein